MQESPPPSASVLEYFRVLRTEIVEAQKLRVQVGLAKTVFLGTLLGFFFKDARGDLAILICPFIALMFDCMVFGLSFNIRDVGSYIGTHLEKEMQLKNEPWQTYRLNRVQDNGFTDWGRIVFRIGNYGLSLSVAAISFYEASRAAATKASSIGWPWLGALMLTLAVAWGILIWREFSKKAGADTQLRHNGDRQGKAKAAHR
jgi:hypothetical protein